MNDSDTSRVARLVALVTLLQTKRTLTASELGRRFAVSTRTIYRDIRTLEASGIPVVTREGKGFSMMDGYRLPPVMFTREEAIALFTAEKLATGLTDVITAQLSAAAMDKLRAALRRADRDHLETLAPHVQVLEPLTQPGQPDTYQQLLQAVTCRQVVRLSYRSAEAPVPLTREIEPIGLYLSQRWHVVAFCRLRQAFRDFRLDRIYHMQVTGETFSPRTESLQHYWEEEAGRRSKQKVVLRLRKNDLEPAQLQYFNDNRHRYGFTHEYEAGDHSIEMVFLVGSLPYLASWLLQFAGEVAVVEPTQLLFHVQELARKAYHTFCTEDSSL